MKFRTCVLIAALATALSACGSSESDPIVNQATDNTPDIGAAIDSSNQGNTDTVTPALPVPTIQTADLQASNEFDFATSWDMNIDFTLPLNNAYLSLCTDYDKQDSGAVEVQFDSCVVRAPITDGQFSSESLPMTNSTNSLIAVLIDYANPSTPTYVEFEVTPGKETLDWSEGVNL